MARFSNADMSVLDALCLGNGRNVLLSRLVLVASDAKNAAVIQRWFAPEAVWDFMVVMVFPDRQFYGAPLAAVGRSLAAAIGAQECVATDLL